MTDKEKIEMYDFIEKLIKQHEDIKDAIEAIRDLIKHRMKAV